MSKMSKCDRMVEKLLKENFLSSCVCTSQKSVYLGTTVILYKITDHKHFNIKTLRGCPFKGIINMEELSYEAIVKRTYKPTENKLIVIHNGNENEYEWQDTKIDLTPIRLKTITTDELKFYTKLIKAFKDKNCVFSEKWMFLFGDGALTKIRLDTEAPLTAYNPDYLAKVFEYTSAWTKEHYSFSFFDIVLYKRIDAKDIYLVGITYHEDNEAIALLLPLSKETAEGLIEEVKEYERV